MALTDNDKQWIKGAIVEGINGALEAVVTPRFDTLEKDVSGLKKDVSGLKQDVSSLKDEMREVKNRLSGVEHEVYEAKERLDRVEGELQALTNDIKEIYDVIYGKPSRSFMSASFAKMSPKERLLVINEELLKMAKATGVVLPR
ncbi:hypothetical protein [Candidatus Nanoperiomorbus periodonticus]|uniref:hypothetical protein n=1 Tax=Candidatus Nanoperiomorbus periodonticus TaxID=2171989 RepID=UPI00101C066E|nr:hypothetical protein [Candidatus Nanoperiomorbus periodonticus]RYC75923.1 hypothetical protein G52EAM_00168 [Candidatus Nanoperiomorbus periodonticus]